MFQNYLMKNYNREVRPVVNASTAVVVHVGITLTQIFDMVRKNKWIIWIPRVISTNILRTTFMCTDHKSAKRQSSQQCCFALLGPTRVKAVRNHIGEINPLSHIIVDTIFLPLHCIKCQQKLNVTHKYLCNIRNKSLNLDWSLNFRATYLLCFYGM